MKNIYSKSRGVLMGVLVLAMIASGVFFRARPALAIPVEVLADVDKTMNQIKGGAFAGAFLSGMQYFINKIAYDSAVWLASGGKGQKPLLFSEPGKYFGDVAKDAAGEALANLNNLDFLKKAGINLCMPPDINLRARIKLDIANGIFGESTNAPVSKCRWDDIAKAYEKIGEPGYWSKVGIAFEPGQNDLSVYMAANNAIKEYSLKKERAARDDAAHKGDTLTPVDPVTGKPTVSKEVAKTEAANSAPSESAKKTEAQANALTPSILDGTWGALILGAKTFTNTLASQLMQRLTTRGFFSGLEGVCYLTNNQQKFCPQNSGSATEQGSFGGKTTAALAFADLLTPKIYTVNDYDGTLMAELGACDAAHRGLYSCAADGSLLAAVSQAKSGKILTVQQAIDQGYLHKDWQLMPPGNQADNQDPYCFSRAYCYSNLIKLRQVNILPVGWELAAQKSNFKQPYTLDFFVKNFNNKNTIAFHLIDPNWLIKLPPTQCKARVFGQFLASAGTADRAEYCADVATCVNEDENGNCSSGQYGYCRQTKNIWHLGGETCPAQFNTCTALVSRAGEATAYVANTINKGVCDASNVGCRAYSNTQKFAGVAQGDWEWQDGNAQLAYFNKDAQSCSADAEGCTRFIRQTESVRGADLNLRKAPDYYKCYAGNATPPGTQSGIFTGVTFSSSTLAWPANHTDLVKLENSLSAEEKQQCGRFAQVCAAEENGCEAYAPANGDPQITGNLSASDLCPQECVGYESFIQQSSFFEPVTAAEPQKYFIPSTGESCNADNAGCDEFVNIEKGGEQKSFFTELHLCSKNPADGATYYTWEGSDTTGYQLKSYVLKKDASIAAKVDANIIGDGKGEVPAYLGSENSSTLSDYAQRCNKDAYANRLTDKNFDTDCREFYDKDGHISYRLWSKTITVDPQGCQKLRKSVSFGANTTERAKTCAETYGTWEVTTNTCVYLAIPSEANTCSAQFNGCRAYKGNGGNNYQIIDTSTFEQATLAPWSGGILSAESTTQGGHSVKIAKKAKEKVLERVFASSTAQKGTTYLVSFWAKGTAGKELKVGLYQGGSADGNTANIENKFALSNNWGVYTAGPFTVNWDKDDVTLAFKPSDQSSDVFVDTISVRKMQDMVYLMRNSWDTPASCDNPLTDSAGLSAGGTADAPERTVPQAMLGCAAYTDRAGKGVSAKSFTNICRAEAVGCEEVKDTHNTQSDAPLYSNAICWLPKQGIGKTFFDSAKIAFPSSTPSVPIEIQSANYTNLGMPCKDAADETLCIIQPGAEFCRFNWSKGSLPTDGAKTTAVFKYNGTTLKTDEDEKFVIKTDGQTQKTGGYATVYLVNDSAYYCAQDALGCAAFGQRSWVATSTLAAAGGVQADYATTYIKNDPAQYDKISCQPEAEGCEQYTTSKGGQTYFKDPKVWGSFVCEWRDNVEYNSSIFNGWFRTGGVGFCGAKGASPAGLANDKITQCAADSDCAPVGGQKQVCNQPLPCYPQYIVDGTTFGIYRAGDSGYNKVTNPVGQCPAQYDSCSEFVDPSDTGGANPNGKAYYVLDNTKLDKASCNGQVSKEQGCVLFYKTSEVNYTPWKSTETYTASQDAGGALVKPSEASGGAGGDANTILKVKRDRVCSEWLTCGSSMDVFDPNTAKTIKQCLTLQSCVKPMSVSVSGVGSVGNCGEYGSVQTADKAFSNNTVATVEKYQNRSVGFAASEFTGYSIPLSYPVEFYKPVQLNGAGKQAKTSLAFVYCPISGGVNCETDSKKNSDSTICENINDVCGVVNGPQGVCDANHRCAIKYSPQDLGNKSVNIQSSLLCRGYPASDAPFSFSKPSGTDIRPLKYKDVNTCIAGQNCECSYNVALYGDPNKGEQQKKGFFEQGENKSPAYLCSGGADDGGQPTEQCNPADEKSCVTVKDVDGNDTTKKCALGGTPVAQFKFDNQYVGWQDYCLEYDTSQVLYKQGGKNVYPCLTWYPVDKAPGAVDIYAQNTEAGYSLNADVYYCAAGDVMLTKTPSGEQCSYIGGGCGWKDYIACLNETSCPTGYFAVVGTCDTGGICDTSGSSLSHDGCPYKCIPNDSVFDVQKNITAENEINGVTLDDTLTSMVKPGAKCYDVAKYLSNNEFKNERSTFNQDDTLKAISMGAVHNDDDTDKNYPDHQFVNNFMNDCLTYGVDADTKVAWFSTNFACRALAQVSQNSGNTRNKAWTDRLQKTDFQLPLVNFEEQNAANMAYAYNTDPQPFGVGSKPTTIYPIMFPVCLEAQSFSLPNPITLTCEGNKKLTNEIAQTRPYQFTANSVTINVCKIANTNDAVPYEDEKYYSCLYDPNASSADSGFNILSAKGQNYCQNTTPSFTKKTCFEDLIKNVNCQKDTSSAFVCVANAGFSKDPSFKGKISCSTALDCVNNQEDVSQVQCLPKYVCNGATLDYFRNNFWDDVLCDPNVKTSCKDYAFQNLNTMCVDSPNGTVCSGVAPSVSKTTNFVKGVARLQQLFAKMVNMWTWVSPTTKVVGEYKNKEWSELSNFGKQDSAFELGKTQEGGLPPQLRPVDGQNNNAEVSLVGQGFSVNGVYGKPASSGKDAIPAYLVQESQLLATLSFYGFADKNHMPLRRIAIDWGDGTDIVGGNETSPVNYYKNKRGKLLNVDGTVSTENGCNTAQYGWGGNAQACVDDDPFTYQHTYLFKKAELDSSHCGLIGTLLGGAFTEFQKQFPNIASNKPACVYTPKVQLLDNWGWCNANSAPANTNCVSFGSGVFGCYADGNEPNGIPIDYCRLTRSELWTPFAGKVIVLP